MLLFFIIFPEKHLEAKVNGHWTLYCNCANWMWNRTNTGCATKMTTHLCHSFQHNSGGPFPKFRENIVLHEGLNQFPECEVHMLACAKTSESRSNDNLHWLLCLALEARGATPFQPCLGCHSYVKQIFGFDTFCTVFMYCQCQCHSCQWCSLHCVLKFLPVGRNALYITKWMQCILHVEDWLSRKTSSAYCHCYSCSA